MFWYPDTAKMEEKSNLWDLSTVPLYKGQFQFPSVILKCFLLSLASPQTSLIPSHPSSAFSGKAAFPACFWAWQKSSLSLRRALCSAEGNQVGNISLLVLLVMQKEAFQEIFHCTVWRWGFGSWTLNMWTSDPKLGWEGNTLQGYCPIPHEEIFL